MNTIDITSHNSSNSSDSYIYFGSLKKISIFLNHNQFRDWLFFCAENLLQVRGFFMILQPITCNYGLKLKYFCMPRHQTKFTQKLGKKVIKICLLSHAIAGLLLCAYLFFTNIIRKIQFYGISKSFNFQFNFGPWNMF